MNFIKNNKFSFSLFNLFINKHDIFLKNNKPDDIYIKKQLIGGNIYEHLIVVFLSDGTNEENLKNLSKEIKNTKGLEELWWVKKVSKSEFKRGGSFSKIYYDKYCGWSFDGYMIEFIVEHNKKIKNLEIE
jgi:hypothetical protein